VVSQYAALAALELAQSDLAVYRTEYERRRDLICRLFRELAEAFSFVRPVAAYYLFPRILLAHESSWAFAIDVLEQVHVAVVPGLAFGPAGEGHIRLCFARSTEDIEEGMRRF